MALNAIASSSERGNLPLAISFRIADYQSGKVIQMSKYGHRPHNWFEGLVNKMGGEENAERFLRGESKLTHVSQPSYMEMVSETVLKVNLGAVFPWPSIDDGFVVEANMGINARGANCWVTVETQGYTNYINGSPMSFHYEAFQDKQKGLPPVKTGYQLLHEVLAEPFLEPVHPNILAALVVTGRLKHASNGDIRLEAPGVILRKAGARYMLGATRTSHDWSLSMSQPLHGEHWRIDMGYVAVIDTRDYSRSS